MRYAVISDIHANIEALEPVVEEIARLNVDRIVCCGDFVGYGVNPNECVEIAQSLGILSISGNHDLAAVGLKRLNGFWSVARNAIVWTRRKLTDHSSGYLRKLPTILVVDERFLLFHGALHPEYEPEDLHLEKEAEFVLSFKALEERFPLIKLAFFGHIHIPGVYKYGNDKVTRMLLEEVKLDDDSLYFINPGSVGQSRDRDPRASFLTYDTDRRVVQFHRVEYARDVTLEKIRAAGLFKPNPLLEFVRRVVRKLCKIVKCADVDY